MNTESAIDLSMKSPPFPDDKVLTTTASAGHNNMVPILRPVPRPPWSIIWYQNLWPCPISRGHNISPEHVTTGRFISLCEDNFQLGGNPIPFPPSFNPMTLPVPQSVTEPPPPPVHSYTELIQANNERTDNPQAYDGSDKFTQYPRNNNHLASRSQSQPAQELITSYGQHSSSLVPLKRTKSLSPPLHKGSRQQADASTGPGASYFHESTSSCDSQETSSSRNTSKHPTGSQHSAQEKAQVTKTTSGGDIHLANFQVGKISGPELTPSATIVDVACCDGPVRFERVSNPNFALTVEHQNPPPNILQPTRATMSPSDNMARGGPTPAAITQPARYTPSEANISNPTNTETVSSSSSTSTSVPSGSNELSQNNTRTLSNTKTYLCIYCNQSFKSLFCYQKHKKRHLNPVSVDITGINVNAPTVCAPENNVRTKDLNVQFFPCKKCGCKFPSYYFVHKHKKTCHSS